MHGRQEFWSRLTLSRAEHVQTVLLCRPMCLFRWLPIQPLLEIVSIPSRWARDTTTTNLCTTGGWVENWRVEWVHVL